MNMTKKYAFIIVSFVSMLGACAVENVTKEVIPSQKNVTLTSLIQQAKEQASEESGKQYWWQVFGVLDKISDDELKPCVSKKPDPSTMYRYVLEIGVSGVIDKIHWDKVDDFTTCIDKVLMGIKLPAPPEFPFYLYLSEI